MECYPTSWQLWRESRNLQILQSPTIQRRLPSLIICRELFSFCHFNSVLARGTAISAGTWVKCKKREQLPTNKVSRALWLIYLILQGIVNYNSLQLLNMLCELSLFVNFWRVCKQNSLKLQEFLVMKNYGITLTRGNYETSGRQKTLQFCLQCCSKNRKFQEIFSPKLKFSLE